MKKSDLEYYQLETTELPEVYNNFEIIYNLLTNALEISSKYWATVDIDSITVMPKERLMIDRLFVAVCNGESVKIYDTDNPNTLQGEINLSNLQRGWLHMRDQHSEEWAKAKSNNDDGYTADVFLQSVVINEVIYG